MKMTEVLSRLDKLEEEIDEIRKIVVDQENIMKLAGSWNDFETTEGNDLVDLKNNIYKNRTNDSRRFDN